MRKREGMKKRRSRILAWLLACFMVLSVIQGTGWGSLTVQAEEAEKIPTDLKVGTKDEDQVIKNGAVINKEGTGWNYNETTNILTLTNANLGDIIYDGGDLNLQIKGDNTIGQIDSKKNAIYITGIENGKLACTDIAVDTFSVENIELNASNDINVKTATVKNVKLNTSTYLDTNILNCSGSQINTADRVYVGGSLNCVDSEIRAGKIDFSVIKRTYTDSIVVDNKKTLRESMEQRPYVRI